MKITLTKPLAHGDTEITELELREPVTGDVAACGYPLTLGDGVATPNAEAIAALIARVSAQPPSVIKQMALSDFNACMGWLLGFFGK